MDDMKDALKLIRLAIRGELLLEVFLRETESIPGLRSFLLLMRWAIIFGIGLRFWTSRKFLPFPEQQWQLNILWSVSIFYLFYSVIVTVLELKWPKVRQLRFYLIVQILVDVICFSAFYYLAGAENSALFLFYLLPIFLAIERLNFLSFVPVMLFIVICLFGVLFLPLEIFTFDIFLRVFLPRASFLGFTGMVGLFFRQTERVQKHTLVSLLDTMGSGVSIINKNMRLLWFNEFERRFVLSAKPGQLCYQVFHNRDTICPDCSVEAVFQTGKISRCLVSHRVKGEDHIYELISGPIREQNEIIAVLSLVNDVSEREKKARRLAILHNVSGLIRAAELDKPERLEEILWRILAGVVATDGIGFERAILVLEENGVLRGKLGIGTLNREDAETQWKRWKKTGLPWIYAQIGDMKGDSRLSSRKLNLRVSQIEIPETLAEIILDALKEDGEPKAKVVLGDAKLPGEIELGTFAIAPLFARGQLIGVLLADDVLNGRPLHHDSRDLEALQLFANQAAIAIETARALTQARLRLAELEALYDTSLEMSAEQPNIQELLKAIVRRATKLLKASGGTIFLLVPGRKEVKAVVTHEMDPFRNVSLKFGQGMAGRVAESGEPMIQNDYHNWSGRASIFEQKPYKDYIGAVVEVPLKWEGAVIGVLAISDVTEDRKFDDEDIHLLERFASQAAVAIGNARLYSYLQTLVNSSPDAIIAADRNGLITHFNEASEQITGYREKEVIGRSVTELYYDGEEEARRINHVLIESERQGRRAKDIRTTVRGSQDERIPIRLAGAILRDELGERIGSIGIMTDLREAVILDRQYRDQQDFLAQLEHYPQDTPINDREDLRVRLTKLVEMTLEFCQLEYIVLFASAMEEETVLQAIAWGGLPSEVEERLPHFNWRKAGLQPPGEDREDTLRREADLIARWRPDEEWRKMAIDGIRGHNANFFESAVCGVPVRQADNYRGVLVFGPFADGLDLLEMADFIKNIAQTITIHALSWLQALYLRARHKGSETSAQLIVHRARMWLTEITGKFGRIKKESQEKTISRQKAEEGEKLAENLSSVISRALTLRFSGLEAEDFNFQRYSLSALVQNCVENFVHTAQSTGRDLVVDSSVEYLPYAEVDPTILSVALGNLIENALKYSYEGTYVRVLSEFDTKRVTITIQDVGERMSEQARDNLSQPGKRWATSARARGIPGTGFGLWDASAIVVAHGGGLDFSSLYHRQHQGKPAHLVRVWMTLPLEH